LSRVTVIDVADYFRFVTLVGACAQQLWRIPELLLRGKTPSSTNA